MCTERLSPPMTESGPADEGRWEATLVDRARSGDEQAFEALVRLHQDRAYRVALRMTGDPQDAQDVVQDAFVRAWQGLPRYRGDASFGTWLTRIVINRCHNARRGVRPSSTLPDDDDMRWSSPGSDREVLASHGRDAAVQAVAALPYDQRAALVLHTFDGLTHAEVGRVLGISESAAKVRVHRARRTLIARLQEWR